MWRTARTLPFEEEWVCCLINRIRPNHSICMASKEFPTRRLTCTYRCMRAMSRRRMPSRGESPSFSGTDRSIRRSFRPIRNSPAVWGSSSMGWCCMNITSKISRRRHQESLSPRRRSSGVQRRRSAHSTGGKQTSSAWVKSAEWDGRSAFRIRQPDISATTG